MNSTDRLKKCMLDFIRAIEKAKKALSVRCGLWFDIAWYRERKHIVRRRWQRKNGMYRKKIGHSKSTGVERNDMHNV